MLQITMSHIILLSKLCCGEYHILTVVELPEKDITLVLDPTNPGIGVVDKGKIYMFSSVDGNGVEPRLLEDFMLYGPEGTINFIKASWGSNIDEKRIEELKKEYGHEALNRELENIKSLENNKEIVPKALINEESAIQTAGSRDSKQQQSERID